MNDYDANDLKNALKGDGNLIDGEPVSYGDAGTQLFWEGSVGDTVDVLGIGVFTVVEHEVGKTGTLDEFDGDYSVWLNWVILHKDDRCFKLSGQYDSWDAQGWDGSVTEVEKVKKTIEVWETKHVY